MRSIFLCLIMILLFGSCQDLGPLLFNNTSTEEYLWDKNPINDYFDKEGNYKVPKEEFHYFTVESGFPGTISYIHAVYLGDINTINEDTVIVYCHGNSENMDIYYPRAQLLYHAGGKSRYGVLMMDYQGYGLSHGTPSEEGLLYDVNACIKWLSERGLSEDRLILYGFSLGSIPSIELSANPYSLRPHKLMLEAPIGSINTMAQNGSGLSMPASFFADLKTNNIEKIKEVTQDLFWIHGVDDGFLDFETHGKAVYDNHQGEYKVAVPVYGGDHSDVPFKYGLEQYMEAVHNFIQR